MVPSPSWKLEDTGYSLGRIGSVFRRSLQSNGLSLSEGEVSLEKQDLIGCIKCCYHSVDDQIYFAATMDLSSRECYDLVQEGCCDNTLFRLNYSLEKTCDQLGLKYSTAYKKVPN
ncbi:hypothetical protein HN385_02440 [archaeon]|jgi:hypothetical protein|nr:hypothetical protein [archaeon]MBT3450776.1 hypothetical protein [archaeon]MBT6868811.1 hypothetical protein [archaeon]MBT7192968.1 hypothetical protein [archaeon]MBT7380934.1 hypothetical protein [archaeon]